MRQANFFKTQGCTFVNLDNIIEVYVTSLDGINDDPDVRRVMADTICTTSHNEDLVEPHRTELYRGTEAECERFMVKFHTKFNVVGFPD